MNKNEQVLKIALKYLDEGGAIFRKFCGLPSGTAYCNAFVDYVAKEGGVAKLYFNGRKETYCPTSIKWCQKNLAQIPPYLAMASDIIYFDWEKNGNPNHIGLVRERRSTSSIYTVEGNTSKLNKEGKVIATRVVAKRTRSTTYVQAIFRPHFKPESIKLAKLALDGQFDYNDIANLQRALKSMGLYSGAVEGVLGKNTVKGLQKAAKVTADGAWGAKTSKAVQKMCGTTADGEFGKKSVIALQKWINKKNSKATTKPVETPTEKPVETPVVKDEPKSYTGEFPKAEGKANGGKLIVNAVKKLAWAYGTSSKKWLFSTGRPKAFCKEIMLKLGWKTEEQWSDCGFVQACAAYLVYGVKLRFLPSSPKTPFGEAPKNYKIVHNGGKVKESEMKPGRLARYKKKKGSQHIIVFLGTITVKKKTIRIIAEGGRGIRFFVIRKDTGKYNADNVKHETIQILEPQPVTVNYIDKGMSGKNVELLQAFLNWYGGYGLKVDGEFGDKTLIAVKDFQKKEGLEVDGQFGKASLEKAKAVKK